MIDYRGDLRDCAAAADRVTHPADLEDPGLHPGPWPASGGYGGVRGSCHSEMNLALSVRSASHGIAGVSTFHLTTTNLKQSSIICVYDIVQSLPRFFVGVNPTSDEVELLEKALLNLCRCQ